VEKRIQLGYDKRRKTEITEIAHPNHVAIIDAKESSERVICHKNIIMENKYSESR
jgi:hypothetical protein